MYLYEHLYKEHKADLKPPEIHTFDSLDQFDKWKTRIEDESYSYFAQQYGKRNGRTYFYCQHDGSKKSHSKNNQPRKTSRRNKKGRIKKGNLCLAMMSLKYLNNGKIEVAYRPTHLHPCRPRDLKHQPLSKATNEFIDKQLAWNVPSRKIVENLRDDSYKRDNRNNRTSIKLKRENLVKVKTITERKRKKKAALRYSNNDSESVRMKVQTLMQEKFNPILVYKPLGEKTVFGPKGSEHLPENVFLLAFQSKEQLEMMVEGVKEILVVDETHSTNQYDFKLLNLVVRDKYNLGYPVAHAVSSHSDEKTLQFVFKAIKERYPELEINCCITDDDPALINSVNAGTGEEVWHILCIWHIHRTVQTNLREHVKDRELVSEIYDVICVLIDEPDEEQFIKLKDSFLSEYSSRCPGFISYFLNTFLPKAPKWAKCYRLKHHGNAETTMLVESFHNVLKTVYMKRVPCKRLDDLIDILLTIEEDYFTRYFNAISLECMSDKDHTTLCSRHASGMKISDSDVTQISSRHWTILSQDKNSNQVYDIIRCADVCSSESCIFICCYCDNLCSHLFTCSCPDMFPLCKHLHKLYSIIETQPSTEQAEKAEPEFYTVENEMTVDNADQNANQEGNMMRRIQSIRDMMKDFDEIYLDNSPVKRCMLPRIEHTLKDLQAQCKVLFKDPLPVPAAMEVKTTTASNEKLQKQLKPFVKKSKKKKKTGLQRPPRQSVLEIKEFLLQEVEENDVDSDLKSLSQLNHEQIDVDIPTTVENPLDHEHVVTPTSDVENPLDILLDYQGLKVSSLHLKALHPTIDEAELPALRQADPKFVHGWLYDEVINVYFKMLETHQDVFSCDTTVALRLCSGNHQFKRLPEKLASKSLILFPANLDGNHWIIIIVEVKTATMWFYNSVSNQGSLLSQGEKKFLSAVALLLRNVFPLVKSWSVKRHFDHQKDLVSCGVHVCWFAHCFVSNLAMTRLENPVEFRRSIYDKIVSLIS